MEDHAFAVIDESEKPAHIRQRFTIGYYASVARASRSGVSDLSPHQVRSASAAAGPQ